jgi:transcriptional regulator with XRE-family HTH domain
MPVGDRIRQVIDEENITVYELSKKTGISQSVISRILSNKTQKPTVKVLYLIADALKVSKTWLTTGEGEMLKSDPPKPNNAPNPSAAVMALKMINEGKLDSAKRILKAQIEYEEAIEEFNRETYDWDYEAMEKWSLYPKTEK